MNEKQYCAKLERISQREKEERKAKEEEAEIQTVQARREMNAALSERRRSEMAKAEEVKNPFSRMRIVWRWKGKSREN
jgi:hypothetical protein